MEKDTKLTKSKKTPAKKNIKTKENLQQEPLIKEVVTGSSKAESAKKQPKPKAPKKEGKVDKVEAKSKVEAKPIPVEPKPANTQKTMPTVTVEIKHDAKAISNNEGQDNFNKIPQKENFNNRNQFQKEQYHIDEPAKQPINNSSAPIYDPSKAYKKGLPKRDFKPNPAFDKQQKIYGAQPYKKDYVQRNDRGDRNNNFRNPNPKYPNNPINSNKYNDNKRIDEIKNPEIQIKQVDIKNVPIAPNSPINNNLAINNTNNANTKLKNNNKLDNNIPNNEIAPNLVPQVAKKAPIMDRAQQQAEYKARMREKALIAAQLNREKQLRENELRKKEKQEQLAAAKLANDNSKNDSIVVKTEPAKEQVITPKVDIKKEAIPTKVENIELVATEVIIQDKTTHEKNVKNVSENAKVLTPKPVAVQQNKQVQPAVNNQKPAHKQVNASQNNQNKYQNNKQELPREPFTPQYLNKNKLVDSENRKSEYFNKFYQNFENFLKNKLLVESQVKIIVGVSGGVDSVSLIDALANVASTMNISLEIAHFNHNLRGSYSKRDEEFVKSIAESYGIPYHVSSANVKEQAKKMSQSIETAARTLRYKFFEKVVLSTKAQFLATAHSADDSAETFLMNLLRGTGLTGLSGIPARRHFHKNTYVIRPFLFLKKSEIISYAEKRKLDWKEDETNQETKYTRNKIRLDLIPKLVEEYTPSIIDLITRTAQNISSADRFITETIKSYIEQVILDRNSNLISFNLPLLFTHSNFIRGEILQTCITNNFKIQPLSLSTIDRIFELESKQSGAVCEIDSALFATKDRDRLIISRKEEKFFINKALNSLGEYEFGRYKLILSKVEKKDVKLGANNNIEYFDMEFMPQTLHIRNWKEGDSFYPLGMQGNVKVSDYLINSKIPNIDKDKVFVLTDKVNIIWVIGKRISEEYKISKSTKEYLKAEWKINE